MIKRAIIHRTKRKLRGRWKDGGGGGERDEPLYREKDGTYEDHTER